MPINFSFRLNWKDMLKQCLILKEKMAQSHSQSQNHIMTDSLSVSMSCRALSGSHDQMSVTVMSLCCALSDERSGLSIVSQSPNFLIICQYIYKYLHLRCLTYKFVYMHWILNIMSMSLISEYRKVQGRDILLQQNNHTNMHHVHKSVFDCISMGKSKPVKSYPNNRLCRPIGLRDIEDTRLFRQVMLYVQKHLLVLISVRGWVHPRAIVRQEGLGEYQKFNELTGIRTRDLPACSIVPQRCQ
jgi:hypothetical protein